MSSEVVQKNVRVSLTKEEWRLLRRAAADKDISLTALINIELSELAAEKARV